MTIKSQPQRNLIWHERRVLGDEEILDSERPQDDRRVQDLRIGGRIVPRPAAPHLFGDGTDDVHDAQRHFAWPGVFERDLDGLFVGGAVRGDVLEQV